MAAPRRFGHTVGPVCEAGQHGACVAVGDPFETDRADPLWVCACYCHGVPEGLGPLVRAAEDALGFMTGLIRRVSDDRVLPETREYIKALDAAIARVKRPEEPRNLTAEFEELLAAARQHLAVHPCVPEPCETEIRLSAALADFPA